MTPKAILRLVISVAVSGFPGLVSGNDAPDLCVVQLDIPEISADLNDPVESRIPERFVIEGSSSPLLTKNVEVSGRGRATAVWTLSPDGAVSGPHLDHSFWFSRETMTFDGRDTSMIIGSATTGNRHRQLFRFEGGGPPEPIAFDIVASPNSVVWSEVLGGYIINYSGGESGGLSKFGLFRDGVLRELGDGRKISVDLPGLDVVALYDNYTLLTLDRDLNVQHFDAPMLLLGEPVTLGLYATADPDWLFIEANPASFLVNFIRVADDDELWINRLVPIRNEYQGGGTLDYFPRRDLAHALRQTNLDADGCLVFSDTLGRVLSCDGQIVIVAGRGVETGMPDGATYQGDLRGIGQALFLAPAGELWTVDGNLAQQVSLPGPVQLASPRLAEAVHIEDVFFNYRTKDPLIAFDEQPDGTITAISLMPETGGPFVPVAGSPAGDGTVLATRTGLFVTQDWKTTTQIWETPSGETIDTTGPTKPRPLGEDQILFATSTGGAWPRVSKFYLLGQCE